MLSDMLEYTHMRENIDCGLCDGQSDVARLAKSFTVKVSVSSSGISLL